MKSGANYNNKRRSFIKGTAAALLLMPFVQFCKSEAVKIMVRLTGTNHILGHRLWAKDFPTPSKTIKIPYLIIGAGIAGLSAARQLVKKGENNFLILDLENHAGGNSSSGSNQYSKYPLGAHYLPLPNLHDKELLNFLEEEKIITGYNGNIPIFDEEQLTFSPQERLYYRNTWQEGLVPKYGNSAELDEEFDAFFEKMAKFKEAKGSDDKYIFDIPLSAASADGDFVYLDKMTMKEWLHKNNMSAPELLEYINYCCRDDFGLGIEYVSAWAGVHYFAARKHNVANEKDNVLTWPEGNARLAAHLGKYSKDKLLLNHIVFDVKQEAEGVTVCAYNNNEKETIQIKAEKVIMCTSQFVTQYLWPTHKKYSCHFNYAPWLLATLTLKNLDDNMSYPLSWDNVIFGAEGLGYIYDQHQNLRQVESKKVITYYHSFSVKDIRKARKDIYKRPKEHWEEMVLNDLEKAHPGLRLEVEEITIHLLGHGMISPVPGFITGNAIKEAAQTIGNRIYFAHSDLSGISIFEEAFHQGINAANNALK